MSGTLAKGQDSEPASPHLPGESGSTPGVIAWSSFFFALLQSICTFFAALDGLRLLIGAGSLAVSAGVGAAFDHFHADWIRVPMILLALLGSLLNLAILYQIRRLRKRPASQWRQVPLSRRKIRMERVQLLLSVATLALIGIEEFLHFRTCHHL
jgi:membrane protein DedA with SNARE-associated domain